MAIGCWTCPVGNTGGPCKHQAIDMKVFQISSWNFLLVVDSEMLRLFHIVATGPNRHPKEPGLIRLVEGLRHYPQMLAESGERPDVVLSSTKADTFILAELTVPWEDRIDKATP